MTDQLDEFDGIIIPSLLIDYVEQYASARRHARAEGIDLESIDVLESYDRNVHPWMHGRRPADIADYLRGLIGR